MLSYKPVEQRSRQPHSHFIGVFINCLFLFVFSIMMLPKHFKFTFFHVAVATSTFSIVIFTSGNTSVFSLSNVLASKS